VFIFVVHKSNGKAAQSRVQKSFAIFQTAKGCIVGFGFCVSVQADRHTDKTVTEEAAFASFLGLRTIF
jgi:hypothetical protein